MENIKSIIVSNGQTIDVDMNSTVLVLNEFQKQWTERGIYHQLIKNQLKKRNVIANVQKILEEWRAKKLPIIHAPIIQDPANKKGFLAKISNAGFFTKDTWKAEFTPNTYKNGDIILEGRYTFNVFEGSNFDQVLKSMNVKTFFICGFTTSLCIKATVEEAKRRGYNFIIINDCSATFTGFLQNIFDKKFNENITYSKDVVKCINNCRVI